MGTKREMIKTVAKSAHIANQQASAAVEAMIEYIKAEFTEGQDSSICIRGFGTFKTEIRAARTAHNPRTGQIIECEARRIVKFKPHSGFRDAIQDKFREEMKAEKQQKAKKQKKAK